MRECLQAGPILSWQRMDIEERLGFRGGKHTDVNHFLALCMALLLVGLFYAFICFAVRRTLFAAMFLDRSSLSIPFLIVFFSAWAVAILFLKTQKLRLQQMALALEIVPPEHDFVLAPTIAPSIVSHLYTLVDNPKHFVLLSRIERALSNLKNLGRVSDVTETLAAQADNDEGLMESSYTILKGFIWGIPVLGFIGTVLGLSISMSGFGETLSAGADTGKLTESLKQITGGLSTAFETTLQGLVAAFAIQLTLTTLKKNEERFLQNCKEYCHAHIISKLRLIHLDDESSAA